LLVLPPNGQRQEYVRVNPHFRVIFTSNPEEYCGVHATQDALMDRLITIHLPAPDELTQQQILVQKVGIDAPAALTIVRVAQGFLKQISTDATSSLRPCLMIANICKEHEITASVDNPDFRDLCRDILLSRAGQSIDEANEVLWTLFNQFDQTATLEPAPPEGTADTTARQASETPLANGALASNTPDNGNPDNSNLKGETLSVPPTTIQSDTPAPSQAPAAPSDESPRPSLHTPMAKIHTFLQAIPHARLSEIEQQTGLNRVAVVNGLRTLIQQQRVEKQELPGKPAIYKAKSL
ncbi:MAG: gas vesicle protein GvpN, partial [Cyanobacteria bacterium J06632_22]